MKKIWREKSLKKNEQSIKDMWDDIKYTNVYVIRDQKERKQREIKTFEGRMDNFPNMVKNIIYISKKILQIQSRINQKYLHLGTSYY